MRAFAAVVIGVAIALALGWMVWRPMSAGRETPRKSNDVIEPPRSARAELPVPQSAEDRQRERYRQARALFMDRLGNTARSVGATVAVEEDLAELVVTLQPATADSVSLLRDRAIQLGAADLGFDRLRFVARDPKHPGVPPQLVAEVTTDPHGRWVTFIR